MANCRWIVIIARQLSSSSICQAALIKPPVPLFGIEGRYATALYSAAVKQKRLENIEKDLQSLKVDLKQDNKLKDFLENPLVKRGVKKDALAAAFAKKNYSSETINLLGMMAENGRLPYLNSVINSFIGIMGTLRGEVLCTVVSAKPLDQPLIKELEATLSGFLKKGEKIMLETKVNPSLIGGLVVSIGDKYIDMSLSTKIKAYSSLLRDVL